MVLEVRFNLKMDLSDLNYIDIYIDIAFKGIFMTSEAI